MRKIISTIKVILKNNIKVIMALLIGIVISGGTVVYAAHTGYLYDSDEVYYDNSESGLTSTDVQAALDELNDKASLETNPTYFATSKPTTSSTTNWKSLNKDVFFGLKDGEYSYCLKESSSTKHCYALSPQTTSYTALLNSGFQYKSISTCSSGIRVQIGTSSSLSNRFDILLTPTMTRIIKCTSSGCDYGNHWDCYWITSNSQDSYSCATDSTFNSC